jgi:putative phosphoribosyl transferase
VAGVKSDTREIPVSLLAEGVVLEGVMAVPPRAAGVVILATGSSTSRYSARTNHLARLLRRAHLGTLLFDMLTESEASDREREHDVRLLATRLLHATEWAESQPETAQLPVGYLAAGVGCAAALVAATQAGRILRAVVCRGGRPDLAEDFLPLVTVPTLCVVAGRDALGLELSERALRRLGGPKQLDVVPDASEEFDESGAMEALASLAAGWFTEHLAA